MTLARQAPATEDSTLLSERENQILHLLARGLTAKESARRLGISDNTVKYHTKRLFAKLGTSRRVQALAEAQKRGLLQA